MDKTPYQFVVIVVYSARFKDRVPCKTIEDARAWSAVMANHGKATRIERYIPSRN